MKKLFLIILFLISNLAIAEDIPTLATHINKIYFYYFKLILHQCVKINDTFIINFGLK